MAIEHEILTFAAASERLGGTLGVFEGSYASVLLFDGDLALDGDFLAALPKIEKQRFDIVAVRGNLTVSGSIALYDERPGLWVGGVTRAETLEGGDCEIYIGAGKLDYIVYGEYNHGILDTGAVEVPWVINSDHDMRVNAPGARWINNFGNDDDYDFGTDNIAESFVPEVLDKSGSRIAVGAFVKHLRAKRPVLLGDLPVTA